MSDAFSNTPDTDFLMQNSVLGQFGGGIMGSLLPMLLNQLLGPQQTMMTGPTLAMQGQQGQNAAIAQAMMSNSAIGNMMLESTNESIYNFAQKTGLISEGMNTQQVVGAGREFLRFTPGGAGLLNAMGEGARTDLNNAAYSMALAGRDYGQTFGETRASAAELFKDLQNSIFQRDDSGALTTNLRHSQTGGISAADFAEVVRIGKQEGAFGDNVSNEFIMGTENTRGAAADFGSVINTGRMLMGDNASVEQVLALVKDINGSIDQSSTDEISTAFAKLATVLEVGQTSFQEFAGRTQMLKSVGLDTKSAMDLASAQTLQDASRKDLGTYNSKESGLNLQAAAAIQTSSKANLAVALAGTRMSEAEIEAILNNEQDLVDPSSQRVYMREVAAMASDPEYAAERRAALSTDRLYMVNRINNRIARKDALENASAVLSADAGFLSGIDSTSLLEATAEVLNMGISDTAGKNAAAQKLFSERFGAQWGNLSESQQDVALTTLLSGANKDIQTLARVFGQASGSELSENVTKDMARGMREKNREANLAAQDIDPENAAAREYRKRTGKDPREFTRKLESGVEDQEGLSATIAEFVKANGDSEGQEAALKRAQDLGLEVSNMEEFRQYMNIEGAEKHVAAAQGGGYVDDQGRIIPGKLPTGSGYQGPSSIQLKLVVDNEALQETFKLEWDK